MSIWSRCALAVLSGVLDALGFIGFGLFPLTWIAKVPVLFAVRDVTPRQAFWLGLLYGVVGNLGGYYWLGETLAEFSGLPQVVSLAVLTLIAGYFALLFALLLGLVRRARRTLGLAPVWALMVVYPALEFVFPNFLPYNIGASQYRFTAITQIVEVTGMLGLTALIGMVNGAVYEMVEARVEKRPPFILRWAVPVTMFLIVLTYGLIRIGQVEGDIAAARQLTVGLIQANHGTRIKVEGHDEVVRRHREMTNELVEQHPEIDLVIWPEAVLFFEAIDLARAQDHLRPGRPLVTGARVREDGGQIFNALLAVEPDRGLVGRFNKVRLVPFSESMPLVETFPVLRRFHPTGQMTERGTGFENLEVADVTLLPTICYEDIMSRFVREMWWRAGPPGVLLNVSNDSWFGDSHEPLIHLALASFRAIETRRALVRSTSTGISALVDPIGRIVSRTDQWREEVLIGKIPVIENHSATPYLRFGDVLGWGCLALTAVGCFVSFRSNRPTVEP